MVIAAGVGFWPKWGACDWEGSTESESVGGLAQRQPTWEACLPYEGDEHWRAVSRRHREEAGRDRTGSSGCIPDPLAEPAWVGVTWAQSHIGGKWSRSVALAHTRGEAWRPRHRGGSPPPCIRLSTDPALSHCLNSTWNPQRRLIYLWPSWSGAND